MALFQAEEQRLRLVKEQYRPTDEGEQQMIPPAVRVYDDLEKRTVMRAIARRRSQIENDMKPLTSFVII